MTLVGAVRYSRARAERAVRHFLPNVRSTDPASLVRVLIEGAADRRRADRSGHAVIRMEAERRSGRRGPDLHSQPWGAAAPAVDPRQANKLARAAMASTSR
jgi:hypothetical protein